MNHNFLYCQNIFLYSLYFVLNISGFSLSALSQSATEKKLFESDEVLEITLNGNFRDALNDRTGKPQKHAMFLSCNIEGKSEKPIPVEIQARGNFRRKKENCTYPPLWIHFPKDGSQQSTVFSEQIKTKLVMPCMNDEYVIREWLVYKIYNLISPLSFRARLIKLKPEDSKTKKQIQPFYAMMLEEEKQMADRNNMFAIEQILRPEQTQTESYLVMAVFEYLIGNTDWSVQYLHNIKLLAPEANAVPPLTVPYDFDLAGIVDAPYAHPAEELQMSSVRERRYRGYCVPEPKLFESVIARFNSLKNDIYSIYNNCKLLDAKYIKATIQYLDEFYITINNPKAWQKDFSYPCDKKGTGNIVIKGLKEN